MRRITRRSVLQGGLAVAAAGLLSSTTTSAEATPHTATRFPGAPPAGSLFYGAGVSGGDPTALEASVGRQLGTYRSYFMASQTPATLAARASRDIAKARFPIISTHINGTWRDNANGAYDQWFIDRITALNAVGPLVFCLDHEPENDPGKGVAADFKAMYLHYKPLVDAHAPNLTFTPIIMSGKYNPYATPNPAVRLNYADWVDPAGCHAFGADGYNHYSPDGIQNWRTPSEVFQPAIDGFHALDASKPIIWAEYGVRAYPGDPSRARRWLWEAYQLCLKNGVSALSFFSSDRNVNDGGTAWTLDGARLTTFKNILANTP
jgi:hypothetical protein